MKKDKVRDKVVQIVGGIEVKRDVTVVGLEELDEQPDVTNVIRVTTS